MYSLRHTAVFGQRNTAVLVIKHRGVWSLDTAVLVIKHRGVCSLDTAVLVIETPRCLVNNTAVFGH